MAVHLALKNKDNCSSAKVENTAIEENACSKPQSYNTIVTGHTCLKKNKKTKQSPAHEEDRNIK